MTQIIYKDIAPGAKEAAHLAVNDLQGFSNAADLTGAIQMQSYASLEPNSWRLDGSFALMPDNPQSIKTGLWSRQQSGADGTFDIPITMSIVLPELFSSVGLSFALNPFGPDWCNHMQIRWYRDAQLLASEDFYPSAWQYFCQKEVRLYNRLMIVFYSMSKPHRFLKLSDAIYGAHRIFQMDELRYVNLFQSASVISESLEVDTLDFRLDSRDPVPYMFQRKQPLEVYHRESLQGVFYISRSRQAGPAIYDINAADMLGLLNESDHHGGIYVNTPFLTLVAEICGTLPFEIDTALDGVTLSGWLPIGTRRDNLAQAAFAAGAVVSTGGSQHIRIFPPRAEISANLDDQSVKEGADVETLALVTGVDVVEHQYSLGTQRIELYQGSVTGSEEILFGEPAGSLQITNGTIIRSNANYALISGSGQVVLTGIRYTHTTKLIRISNPDIAAGDISRVIRVESATLVSSLNSQQVASRVYEKYQKRRRINASAFLGEEMPGDAITIHTEFEGIKTGTIESLDVALDGMRTGRVTVLSD